MSNTNDNGNNKPKYWKSLNVLNNAPASQDLKKREFMEGATDKFEINDMPHLSRRKFMALLGAGAALTATACQDYRDKGEIVPYNRKPDEITPGLPNYYSSTFAGNPYGWGVLIQTREGRPIKVDGNPDHPINRGKVDAIVQTSLVSLYDPSRITDPQIKSRSKLLMHKDEFQISDWEQIYKELKEKFQEASSANKEIALISHTITSPSAKKLLDELQTQYPTVRVYPYELFDNSERRQAWKRSHGGEFPVVKWEKAKVILALESDFLGAEGDYIENLRRYIQGKNVDDLASFNKLYSVEAAFSLTGANADIRLRLSPEYQYEFVNALIHYISSDADDSYFDNFIRKTGIDNKKLYLLVHDLIENRGESIVYAGDSLPAAIHEKVNQLNDLLGAQSFYDMESQPVVHYEAATTAQFRNLVNSMNSGNVGVVIHYDSNPVYHLPYDLGYRDAYQKVPVVISMIETRNESSEFAHYTLPINHNYESWGDHQTRTGYISLQQPVISPLYRTRQKEEILLNIIGKPELAPDKSAQDFAGRSIIPAAVTGPATQNGAATDTAAVNGNAADTTTAAAAPTEPAKPATQQNVPELEYHKFLMRRWMEDVYGSMNTGASFDVFWYNALHDGIISYTGGVTPAATTSTFVNTGSNFNSKELSRKSGFTLILTRNFALGDGRWANNGWLQELPDHVSKVVWDNFASIAPATAKKLGVDWGSMVNVKINDRSIDLPVAIQPGMAEETVSVKLGYGRWIVGEVGEEVGFNANVLMSADSGLSKWIYTGATVTKIPGSYKLTSTQEHHSLDDDFVKDFHISRGIVQETTVAEYIANPKVIGGLEGEPISMYKDYDYGDIKWGMAIDMNKCTGCDVCSTACSMENNVPVVGKDQVDNGREMSWIRIDRYYSGTPEDPSVSYQPMLCQHCDNAPCENVCPVVATTHSPDGINQMTYNRCVGTRYCANNCPYKVRRFNFFDFRDHFRDQHQYADSMQLIYNPEVTVRSRGVMEKCTFCIQRIMEGRQEAIKDGVDFTGEGITSACQQACPTEAITFGNINDPKSKVAQLREHNLGYKVLELLNVRPNVTYIAKLKNINPEGKA